MSYYARRRYYSSGRTRNFNNYNGYRNYSYNCWHRATGIRDARILGRYTHHDMTVLEAGDIGGNVQIVTWMRQRPICFVHGGIFYFGKDAVAMLENQAQYMLPKIPGSDTTSDSFSFGIVPHTYSDKATIATTLNEAYVLTYNFIVSNVMPIVALGDESRIIDMFTSIQDDEHHQREHVNRVDDFYEIFRQVYLDVKNAPFNPANTGIIRNVIGRLIDANFIVTINWVPDYRYRLRGWISPLAPYARVEQAQQPPPEQQHTAMYQQPQQSAGSSIEQRSQQPRGFLDDDDDDDDDAFGGN